MKIKGEIHQDNNAHSYCPHCWSEEIYPYSKNGREYYRCDNCGYDDSRFISIYPHMRYCILDDNELLHYSVGAVITWKEKILLFRRRLYPFQYTIIAGHWDLNDATPEAAIVREIQEEAGIELYPKKSLVIERLKEPCRRGADFHEWHLYEFVVEHNKVTMSEEADIMGWYSNEEIHNLELTIPTEYFLKKLNFLKK